MRPTCARCLKALSRCYCGDVRPVCPGPRVVLLVHPREDRSRRAVNTARMVARCVEGTELFVGRDFRGHARLGRLLADPTLVPLLLYPGPEAVDVAALTPAPGRRPLLVVPDGTWLGTRQILRLSDNVAALPRVQVQARHASLMTFRRQPAPECLCTLEAVHAALVGLERWCPSGPPEALEAMLAVLRRVVDEQVALGGARREAGGSPI